MGTPCTAGGDFRWYNHLRKQLGSSLYSETAVYRMIEKHSPPKYLPKKNKNVFTKSLVPECS